MVLPAPAGPDTSVTRLRVAWSSRPLIRRRRSTGKRGCGIWSLPSRNRGRCWPGCRVSALAWDRTGAAGFPGACRGPACHRVTSPPRRVTSPHRRLTSPPTGPGRRLTSPLTRRDRRPRRHRAVHGACHGIPPRDPSTCGILAVILIPWGECAGQTPLAVIPGACWYQPRRLQAPGNP